MIIPSQGKPITGIPSTPLKAPLGAVYLQVGGYGLTAGWVRVGTWTPVGRPVQFTIQCQLSLDLLDCPDMIGFIESGEGMCDKLNHHTTQQ